MKGSNQFHRKGPRRQPAHDPAAPPPPPAERLPGTLILTVGTSGRIAGPGPARALAQAIQRRRPRHFLLVPGRSRDSLALAAQVLESLDPASRATFVPWRGDDQPFLCIDNPDQLESACATLRTAIREARDRFPDEPIVLSPVSGSRIAAAATILAALDEGTGTIEGGRAESPAEPFDAAGWRARHAATMAASLWDQSRFSPAAEVLRTAAAPLPADHPLRTRLTGLAHAADGFARLDACLFAAAEKDLRDAQRLLPDDEANQALHALHEACRHAAERAARSIKAQAQETPSADTRELLGGLVDGSVRAARAERFDDAADRLLRAIEVELQLRLAAATAGELRHGRPAKGRKVPEALRDPRFLARLHLAEPPREFSPEQTVHALHALGDPSVADLYQDLTDPRRPSEWRQALAIARSLARGPERAPVDKADYKNLRRVAGRFLGMHLSESHPLPPWHPRWLE